MQLYAAPLSELDNVKFAKLVRHAGLVDCALSSAEVDLCFALSKPHGKRKLSYDDFLIALDRIGTKCNVFDANSAHVSRCNKFQPPRSFQELILMKHLRA
jgi:hypothetical protein